MTAEHRGVTLREPKLAASISPERRGAVESACRTWINRLIDPSRRNNLLFFRHLQEGTLDLSTSPSDAIATLVGPACAPVRLADLVSADAIVTAAAKLQEIRKRAVVNEEERGLETLFLALGMASWPASDDGRPYAAPVLQLPIKVEQTGIDRRRLTLTRAGEVQPNLVLLHYLETQKVQVSAEQLVSLVEGDDQEEDFDLQPALQYLTAAASGLIPQFSIAPHFIVGNFSLSLNHKVPDCLYLALAEREGAAIATADGRLARLARTRGVPVLQVPSA